MCSDVNNVSTLTKRVLQQMSGSRGRGVIFNLNELEKIHKTNLNNVWFAVVVAILQFHYDKEE